MYLSHEADGRKTTSFILRDWWAHSSLYRLFWQPRTGPVSSFRGSVPGCYGHYLLRSLFQQRINRRNFLRQRNADPFAALDFIRSGNYFPFTTPGHCAYFDHERGDLCDICSPDNPLRSLRAYFSPIAVHQERVGNYGHRTKTHRCGSNNRVE